MEEFSQLFCGVAHWHSEPWTLRISRCWSFQECQISGCYPVILWVCPNMAKSSWETLQVTLLSPLNCESKNTFLVITVAYCICRAKTSHQIRGCLFLVASLWHMNALFSHLWELWSPDLGSSFLLLCHPLCNITELHRAPWTSSLNEIWDLPWGQRQSPAHSCSCSFTDCDLYVSFLTSSQLIQFSSFYSHM